METKLLLRFAALLALATAMLAGCAQPAAPSTAATAPAAAEAMPAAAAEAGELIVYTSRSESLFKPGIEAFNGQ